jgi:hypothetical protein
MLVILEQLTPWLAKLNAWFSVFIQQSRSLQIFSKDSLLNDLAQWIIGAIAYIEKFSTPFITALEERLLPMIVEYESIWQDPLWQILALVFLVVIIFFIGSRLLSIINQVFLYIFQNVEAAIKTLFRWIFSPFKWLYSKLVNVKSRLPKASFWQRLNFIQVRRAAKAVQYLTTQKDWRYNTPWFLLIGENASGKNDLINAANEGRRTQLLPEEKSLKYPGSSWHFFKHAIVIVPSKQKEVNDTTLLSAYKKDDEENTAPVILAEQQYAERFKYLIQLLHWYRPERPVDGIILTVSATTLLNLDDPANLQVLGENLFKQLWQSQKQSGFVLPVYIVVTQCEHIEGFEEFWQAQESSKYNEMIGWSNPYRLDTAYASDWVNQAFTQVLADLESAKLQLAASGKEINNIDKFMLFKHYFSGIQKPLTEVLTRAFARSSFQEALPLRGIYFTGKVSNKVSFVNDLLSKKIFAEKHLAFPIEKRRFSTQKTLRQFQISSLIVGALLIVLMVSDSIRLQSFNTESKRTFKALNDQREDCTPEGIQTSFLLSELTKRSKRPLLLSNPLSWVSTQENKEQHWVAKEFITPVLFKSLACRLEAKAEIVMSELSKPLSDNYPQQLEKLTNFTHLLVDYYENRQRFRTIVKPFDKTEDLEKAEGIDGSLKTLLNYLYNGNVTESVNTSTSLVIESIKIASFNFKDDNIDSKELLNYLEVSAQNLQTLLLNYAPELPLRELKEISETTVQVPKSSILPASALLDNINSLQDWLTQIEKDWLTATEANSPCGSVYQLLSNAQRTLSSNAQLARLDTNFSHEKLVEVVNLFSLDNCDKDVRKNLAKIEILSIDKIFEFNTDNKLVISDELASLIIQVAELENLNFITSTYPAINSLPEKVVAWSAVSLQELLNILINYQAFVADHQGKSKLFFANNVFTRLQQVTERLISAAQIRQSEQKFVSYFENTVAEASEAELAKSVTSFANVSDTFIQIKRLLQQLGDNSNALKLQQTVDDFVLQQLAILEQLMAEERIYQAVPFPLWDKRDYTRILFNLGSDAQIKSFVNNQQRRMNYLAFSYAEPLVQFLQNSASPSINNDVVQRWFHTINDLGRVQRNVSGNEVEILNSFVSETLVGINNGNCFEHKNVAHKTLSLGWFAKRKQQLASQVNLHCKTSGDTQLIDRYLAIQSRFNKELAGKFPFSEPTNAGTDDVSPNQLRRFLQYYRLASTSLLNDMNTYRHYNASGIPSSWFDFINQLDQMSDFFQKVWNDKNKQWQVPLSVQFAALPEQAKGSNQIIGWRLGVAKNEIAFPNGQNKISWEVGQQLSLNLRWASGSAFVPTENLHLVNPNLHIKTNNLSAVFTTKGSWGLFEWLANYSADELLSLRANQQNQSLLSFDVPVGLKNVPSLDISDKKVTAQSMNITRSNLLMWFEFVDDKGDKKRMALPNVLPYFAPGLGG